MRATPWVLILAAMLVSEADSRAAPAVCTGFMKSPMVVPLDPALVDVIDGDTIREHRDCATSLRFDDIDAPDRKGHEKCREEGALGDKSYERLLFMMRGAKSAEFRTSGETDRYGRPLGILLLDGKEVGPVLVKEGLACPSIGAQKVDWCAKPFRCRVG